jgi:hypothetical protein
MEDNRNQFFMERTYKQDIELLKESLTKLPVFWEGKASVLELKEADYNWRQMEWWAFYLEYKVRQLFSDTFQFPGDKYGNVKFDMKGAINWDIRTCVLNHSGQYVYLNDVDATNATIKNNDSYGITLATLYANYDGRSITSVKLLDILFFNIRDIDTEWFSTFTYKNRGINNYAMDIDDIEPFCYQELEFSC